MVSLETERFSTGVEKVPRCSHDYLSVLELELELDTLTSVERCRASAIVSNISLASLYVHVKLAFICGAIRLIPHHGIISNFEAVVEGKTDEGSSFSQSLVLTVYVPGSPRFGRVVLGDVH